MFSGDTTVNDDLIALAREADILVHCIADLGYLERHGTTGAELERMAGLHTDVMSAVPRRLAPCPRRRWIPTRRSDRTDSIDRVD
ncbi:MAG: hypothetical protein ACLP50_03685 [Solirubrobacteraceae bacterium]